MKLEHRGASPALLAAVVSLGGFAHAQSTVLISADAQGHCRYGENVFGVSADGRYALMWGGTWSFGNSGLAVRDLATGAIDIVDLHPGAGGGQGIVWDADWSSDRRFVVFTSTDDTLVPGDNNGFDDAFLRDRQTGAIEIVSRDTAGGPGNDHTYAALVSDDGRFVALGSSASDLIAGDTNNRADVFVRDRQLATTTRVSLLANGSQASTHVWLGDMSRDGRYVLLIGTTELVSGAPVSTLRHLTRRDLVGGTSVLVDLAPGGALGDGETYEARISDDGRWVAFRSMATNLVAGDMNQLEDTFLRDVQSGTTQLVSRTPAGASCNFGSTWNCPISADGRFVVFMSQSTDLVPGDTNNYLDYFLFDRQTAAVERVSVRSDGAEATNFTQWIEVPGMAAISADGRYAAFSSSLSTLTPGAAPTLVASRVYLRDRASPCAPITAYCTPKTNSQACEPWIGASGEPRASGSDSFFVWAQSERVGPPGALLWSLQPASLPFGGGTLCIGNPIARTPAQTSTFAGVTVGPCHGEYTFHLSQAFFASNSLISGTTVYCQYMGRDNGFAPPNNVSLTGGLTFNVGP